jgi:hypothetical protein
MVAVEQARKTDFDQRGVPKWYRNISAVRKNQQDFWKKLNCEEDGYW